MKKKKIKEKKKNHTFYNMLIFWIIKQPRLESYLFFMFRKMKIMGKYLDKERKPLNASGLHISLA